MSDASPTQPESSELEEIPVEDLIRMTREFTRRITNQDRQRLGLDLRESGHSRSLQITAPITLQQFFAGEIDLDSDLARRFVNAPLLSSVRFVTHPAEAGRRQATALFSSNDDAAIMTADTHIQKGQEAALELTFTLYSALGLRFRLPSLGSTDRRRWLDLMRRSNGIAFLWTRERWEQPYLVFVVRDYFVRLYAFSPHGFEAAARLTPDMAIALVDWLEGLWFPGQASGREEAVAQAEIGAAALEDRTRPDLPARHEEALRAAIPHTPEEQWEDDSSQVAVPPPDAAPKVPSASVDIAPPEKIEAPPAQPDVRESDLSANDLDW
jgi:hypothetical protein